MIAAPLSRMLWKEYRQQRTLWLAILLLGLVLQVVLRIALAPTDEVALVVLGVAVYLVPFYLIGCSAILFAGEREERTSDWLVSLAAPPQWTLVAKLGFAVVSSLAMLGVLVLWGLVLCIGLQLPRLVSDAVSAPDLQWGLFWGALSGLLVMTGLLAWGVLGSLTSRRVIVAVPTALFWWLMTMLVPLALIAVVFGNDIGRWRQTLETISLWTSFGTVVAVDLWLGWRWCQGKYVDAQFLDDLNERLHARLRWGGVRVSRFPTVVESEHAGWRTWQRLVWQERRRESLHSFQLWIGCGIGVFLAFYSCVRHDSITIGMLPLIVPLPLAMGILGFRFDAAGQQLRFLSQRGTSPGMVWLAKHVVWLPRAFWISIVVFVVACLAEWAFIPSNVSGVFANHQTGIVRSFSIGVEQQHPLGAMLFEAGRHWDSLVWFVLLSYGIGQVASMLLRQIVLAVAAGLVLSSLFAGWLWLMVVLDVPRWWSVGVLVVWLICVTWWYSGPWLLERRSWSTFRRLAVGLLAPPLLLVGAVATYRALEVPGFGPSSSILFAWLYPREYQRRMPLLKLPVSSANGGLMKDSGPMSEPPRSQRPVTPEEQAAGERLAGLTGGFNTVQMFREQLQKEEDSRDHGITMGMYAMPSPVMPPGVKLHVEIESPPADALLANREQLARDAFWMANEPRLKELLEIAQRESCESPKHRLSLGGADLWMMPQQRLLLEAARLRTDEGELDEALKYYCASLRLATFWVNRGGLFGAWSDGERQQAVTLQAVVDWANHPSHTEKSLLSAMRQVAAELARFPTAREAVVAQFVEDSEMVNYLMAPDPHIRMIGTVDSDKRFAAMFTSFAPWEAIRLRRLLEQQLFWRYQALGTLEVWLKSPGVDVPRLFAERLQQDAGFAEDERLRQTTPLAFGLPQELDPKILQMVVDREAVMRVSLLAMALLAWKQEHGEKPDYLAALAPYCLASEDSSSKRVLPVMTLNDPWTGAMFDYYGVVLQQIEKTHGVPVVVISISRGRSRPAASMYQDQIAIVDDSWRDNRDSGTNRVSPIILMSQKGRLSVHNFLNPSGHPK